jgi:DNA transformation protein
MATALSRRNRYCHAMAEPEFVSHCRELLAPLGAVRARRMFGGWGLYVDDLFVALIAFDRLYLKADEGSRPRFEAAGCQPFVYQARDKTISLGYWTAPDEALESPALMAPWARLALQAALSARAAALRPRKAQRTRPAAAGASPAGAKPRARPKRHR